MYGLQRRTPFKEPQTLGFALKDISEHLPGAFIIYRADKENDELFYANQEFLHMAGYKDMDELFRLTKKSFSNLIREDEKKKIEASIWKQIDNGNGNDYIHFHLRRADGSYLSVLDHGRIVESQQYGKVFYVLFMDWEDMKSHYSENFPDNRRKYCKNIVVNRKILLIIHILNQDFFKFACWSEANAAAPRNI